jgi:hypothetical protein
MPSCKRAGACLGYTPSWFDSGHESRVSPCMPPAQRAHARSEVTCNGAHASGSEIGLSKVSASSMATRRGRPASAAGGGRLAVAAAYCGNVAGKGLLDSPSSRWPRSMSAERSVAGCFISLGLVGTAAAEDAPTRVDSAADDAPSFTPRFALAPVSEETPATHPGKGETWRGRLRGGAGASFQRRLRPASCSTWAAPTRPCVNVGRRTIARGRRYNSLV